MASSDRPGGLQQLQTDAKNVRNICILAHVDHGKTTLADSLIASNGIISRRQAGKLRYMDNRKDEQVRGITMKSSAIALGFTSEDGDYLINLIDSPGHVDFSSEVSTAVRLCDGALVVVDVIEGVCPQTQVVLEQAWREGITPCLVLNKMDRLVTELKLTPTEAYYHIQSVLEKVNALSATLWMTQMLQAAADTESKAEENSNKREEKEDKTEDVVYDWSSGLEEKDDSHVYFSPEQGNVVFCSALDGWGFRVSQFAGMYSRKLGVSNDLLHKTLWGDYYLNTKTKRIHKGAFNKGKKPLFVQLVLENLWSVYEAVLNKDKARIDKITSSLQLKILPRDSRHTDPRVHLFAVCSQWLPLAPAVLEMVTAKLPSPMELSEERVEQLMCSNSVPFSVLPEETQQLKKAFLACSGDESAPVIAFISKMFSVDESVLPSNKPQQLSEDEIRLKREQVKQKIALRNNEKDEKSVDDLKCSELEETQSKEKEEEEEEEEAGPLFLAFARVFSGTLRKGQELFVLQPRYDPRLASESRDIDSTLPLHTARVTVDNLFQLMGREVTPVECVSAGSVVGIGGLTDTVLKSATLSSTLSCPAFREMTFAAAPIVRVAIETDHVTDMPALVRGMKLLNQADPCVEVMINSSGEHVLAAAGEVHLQRCIDDLRDTFARVKLKVSSPIIPFRETVVHAPTVDMVNELISDENEVKLVSRPSLLRDEVQETGTQAGITVQTADKSCSLFLVAKPLPEEVTSLLEKNSDLLQSLAFSSASKDDIVIKEDTSQQLLALREKLAKAFTAEGKWWECAEDKIWAFGPRNTGPNILLNMVPSYDRPSVWAPLDSVTTQRALREHDNSIVSGFQLAALAGPLCEEPLHGVCFTVTDWSWASERGGEGEDRRTGETRSDIPSSQGAVFGPVSGQLISAMKEGCRRAFLAQPCRLMAAMYSCDIQATADVLGRVYAVLGRRSGRVLHEEMREGSVVFIVKATLPVAESFGFAADMRVKTSGLASPQLVFSHWEVIPHDPFWVPSTVEELQHFGEKADSDSIARQYMNAVRRRKGLAVEEKLVEHAEKQRTLKRNK